MSNVETIRTCGCKCTCGAQKTKSQYSKYKKIILENSKDYYAKHKDEINKRRRDERAKKRLETLNNPSLEKEKPTSGLDVIDLPSEKLDLSNNSHIISFRVDQQFLLNIIKNPSTASPTFNVF